MKQPKLHLKYKGKLEDKEVDVLFVNWDNGQVTHVKTESDIYFKIDDGSFVLDIYEKIPRVKGELIWESYTKQDIKDILISTGEYDLLGGDA
jgi:hypothetical protein